VVLLLLHVVVLHHHLVLLRCVRIAHHPSSTISTLLPTAVHVRAHAAGSRIRSKRGDPMHPCTPAQAD
jgi:hypothetical protein